MGNVLQVLAGGSSFLIAASAGIFVLVDTHPPWLKALESAGLLLWASISFWLLAVAGVLKLGAMIRKRTQQRKISDRA